MLSAPALQPTLGVAREKDGGSLRALCQACTVSGEVNDGKKVRRRGRCCREKRYRDRLLVSCFGFWGGHARETAFCMGHQSIRKGIHASSQAGEQESYTYHIHTARCCIAFLEQTQCAIAIVVVWSLEAGTRDALMDVIRCISHLSSHIHA